MKILRFLFVLFIFMLPSGELLRYQSTSGIGITANDFMVGLLVAYWLFYHTFRRKGVNYSFLTKPLLFFVGIALVSLAINSRFLNTAEFIISFLYLVRWVFYAAIFFIVKDFNDSFKQKIRI
ncbi:hypothetical protein M1615_03895 [Patescibacteria group bacterium]|nr:hypothetical protein [Patescibacteria group bacterium]